MSDACCPATPACCADPENIMTPVAGPGTEKDLPTSVVGEVTTAIGPIPRVAAQINSRDRLWMWKIRWGIGRMNYTVAPGLYAVGEPDEGSEVLVTANYRLTFDLLRRSLHELDVWILVLDTQGINVWCAAGKGTFGTDELVRRIEASEVGAVVKHRRLIVPQLGAPGIAAHEVNQRTGFRVIYGPVEAGDIKAYLENGRRATPAMRRKMFPLSERAALVPMELVPAFKWVLYISAAVTLISGVFGRGTFAGNALQYGPHSLLALALGTVAGAVAAPLLLPWLPGRSFALKGAVAGAAAALMFPVFVYAKGFELAAWTLVIISLASFFTMNFTGSSTYTSLSGVKKEMREAVPFQITAASGALVLWLIALFTGGAP